MLGEKIKGLRLGYGLNQVCLAKELGVSKQCVSNWENDNIQPSIDMLVRLAKFFNVSTDFLLDLRQEDGLDVTGLTEREVSHLKFLIEDLRSRG